MMVDYTAMTNDELRAYIEEHETLAADAQEVLDARQRDAFRAMKDESAPYFDEAMAFLETQGYRLEREPQYFEPGQIAPDNQCIWWRLYFPPGSDGRPFLFAKSFKEDEQDIQLDFAINILGNLRTWHEQQQKTV